MVILLGALTLLAWLWLRHTTAPATSPPVALPVQSLPAPAPKIAVSRIAVAESGGREGPANARHDELAQPHPITPEHERIFRENALVGAMNGAMDVKDGPGLRRILDEYCREFPDDPNRLQEGYRIIADCLEHPGADSVAAGRRYDEQERGSILRRFVQRHCLEP